jgi:hypothetical protein
MPNKIECTNMLKYSLKPSYSVHFPACLLLMGQHPRIPQGFGTCAAGRQDWCINMSGSGQHLTPSMQCCCPAVSAAHDSVMTAHGEAVHILPATPACRAVPGVAHGPKVMWGTLSDATSVLETSAVAALVLQGMGSISNILLHFAAPQQHLPCALGSCTCSAIQIVLVQISLFRCSRAWAPLDGPTASARRYVAGGSTPLVD